jgi:hypothetical protein
MIITIHILLLINITLSCIVGYKDLGMPVIQVLGLQLATISIPYTLFVWIFPSLAWVYLVLVVLGTVNMIHYLFFIRSKHGHVLS